MFVSYPKKNSFKTTFVSFFWQSFLSDFSFFSVEHSKQFTTEDEKSFATTRFTFFDFQYWQANLIIAYFRWNYLCVILRCELKKRHLRTNEMRYNIFMTELNFYFYFLSGQKMSTELNWDIGKSILWSIWKFRKKKFIQNFILNLKFYLRASIFACQRINGLLSMPILSEIILNSKPLKFTETL